MLFVAEMVPYFLQNDVSYVRFPTLRDAYMTFDVEIAFRPETTDGMLSVNLVGRLSDFLNPRACVSCTFVSSSAVLFSGLLLYNGEYEDRSGDFLSLGMSGRALEFRFDTGSGPTIIRSAPLALNQWHVARIKRLQSNG